MRRRVDVSIICLTFNHRDYIRDCIEGILKQKTQYSYELLIHDDSSTDGTIQILKEYEEKYPDIIRMFYETENQYQKGIEIVGEYLISEVKGRFVAYCDGDDYWTDEYKLQKQVDYLLKHPNIVGCVTNALVHDYKSKSEYAYCSFKRSRYIGVSDILYGSEPIIKPSAWLIRAEDFIKEKDIINYLGGYGDISVQLWMLSKSRIRFMKDISIVYRQYVAGSWTDRFQNVVFDTDILVEKFNYITHYKYDKHIWKRRKRNDYRRINETGDMGLMCTIGIRQCINCGCYDLAVSIFLYRYMPLIYKKVRCIWRKLNKL